MKVTSIVDTSMLFDDNKNKTLGFSFKIKMAMQTNQTQEMIGKLVLTYL